MRIETSVPLKAARRVEEAQPPIASTERVFRTLRSLRRGRIGLVGIILLIALFTVSAIPGAFAPYDPTLVVGRPLEKPSALHILGTNDIGQDILSELLWATRVSLATGLIAAFLAVSIGLMAGVVAGFFGHRVDMVLMRVVDLVMVVPFLPLMILLAAYVGPSFRNLILVIAALYWAGPARVLRSQAISIRGETYVEAARSVGVSQSRILLRYIVPGVLPLALSEFVLAAGSVILVEAALSFLGLGDPIQKSWGSMLYYAQARGAFLTGAWVWWVLPPGAFITLSTLSFALTGFAMEEVLDPRLRSR